MELHKSLCKIFKSVSSPPGISGAQSYGNSLSAFGPMGASGLPLDQIRGGPGTARQNRVIPRASSSNPSFYRHRSSYSSSHLSLQRAFALYRDDKRKRRAGRREEEMKTKERLELMSAGYRQLLEQKGLSSAEGYKRAMEKEKRRVAKKMYRETLSEGKKAEIKEKDKERKRMKRATRSGNAESVSNIMQQFSLGFSDGVHGLGCDSIENASRTGSGSVGGSLGIGVGSIGSIGMGSDSIENTCRTGSVGGGLGIGSGPIESSLGIDSGFIETTPRAGPGSVGGSLGISARSVGSSLGIGAGSVGVAEIGLGTAETVSRLGSGSVGDVPGMASASVESVSWIDSVSFDTGSEERVVNSASTPSDCQNPMKLD